MTKISGYSFSLVLFMILLPAVSSGQDTISFPLRFGLGAALYSPVSALAGIYPRGLELNGIYDIDERLSVALDGGYSRFVHDNYNYRYENNGLYMRLGVDYNLLNPVLAEGRYFAGGSLRYGLSGFTHTTPVMEYDSYWGNYTSSAVSSFQMAHFLDVSPGIRAELFKNVFIGWSVNMRVLIWSGAGKDLRAVEIPGFGNGSKKFSAGLNYYLSLRIPYRTKTVIWIKPVREDPEDPDL
jgi:hypothetical protein